MSHDMVYQNFKLMFPQFAVGDVTWFPNGKNSIRIRIAIMKQQLIFTYDNDLFWKLETMDSFLKAMNEKGRP